MKLRDHGSSYMSTYIDIHVLNMYVCIYTYVDIRIIGVLFMYVCTYVRMYE